MQIIYVMILGSRHRAVVDGQGRGCRCAGSVALHLSAIATEGVLIYTKAMHATWQKGCQASMRSLTHLTVRVPVLDSLCAEVVAMEWFVKTQNERSHKVKRGRNCAYNCRSPASVTEVLPAHLKV